MSFLDDKANSKEAAVIASSGNFDIWRLNMNDYDPHLVEGPSTEYGSHSPGGITQPGEDHVYFQTVGDYDYWSVDRVTGQAVRLDSDEIGLAVDIWFSGDV